MKILTLKLLSSLCWLDSSWLLRFQKRSCPLKQMWWLRISMLIIQPLLSESLF